MKGQRQAPAAFYPVKDPVPILQEAGWAPGPVWTAENLAPTGFRSPDCPAHSQSLYRLSYAAHRNLQYFVSKNAEWLEQEINLHIKDIAKASETDYEMMWASGKSGRRKLAFEDRSEKSKRRKSKDLRKTVRFPELTHATKMSLISAGKTDAAALVSEAVEATPTREIRIRKAWVTHTKNVWVLFTPEEALSLFIEAHLTKSQYIKIRIQAKNEEFTSTQVSTQSKR